MDITASFRSQTCRHSVVRTESPWLAVLAFGCEGDDALPCRDKAYSRSCGFAFEGRLGIHGGRDPFGGAVAV
ncbi:hypothetical protein B296_00036676 [Ensete ventricosum]|uniref:Uncharacterized protein n=1 Tax=Ensete ventricosum TaxID=4639 RepID=A0A426XU63_ENSVE|nr:hypothetical protein B296_00036676 [Ensete ventricosum]